MSSYTTPENRFADIDKTFRDDVNLCWLASACSMIWSAGWAVPNKWETPTALFEEVKTYFKDEGCNALHGALWYLCGAFPRWGKLNNIYKSGGNYRTMNITQASSLLYGLYPENMYSFLDYRLQYDAANNTSLMGGFTTSMLFCPPRTLPLESSSILGAHEVPLWGFELNEPIPSGVFDDLPSFQPDWNEELYGDHVSSVYISDPDDEQYDHAFTLYAYYHPEAHCYLLRPDPNDNEVPSNWQDGRSIWMNTMTYLVKNPNTEFPSEGEPEEEQE